MANPWFRLYSEIIEDEKILMLAFQDRWHFVALLCLKNKGVLDKEKDNAKLDRKVAVKLGLSLSESDELRRRLMDEDLIAADWQPYGWASRQFQSDNSTDRVRKYRERMKRGSNVSETAQDTDSEADTESDSESQSAREVSALAFGSRLVPDDFEPDEKFHVMVRGRNPGANYEKELGVFKNHEFAQPKTDWQRAWAKWWLNAKPEKPNGSNKTQSRIQNILSS